MKKIILSLIFGLLFTGNVYSKDSKQDSVCHDLLLFFISQRENKMTEEKAKSHEGYYEDDYCSSAIIYDILDEKDYDFPNIAPNIFHEEFGVYGIDEVAVENGIGADYILIKNVDSYKIFLLFDITPIIIELIKIKDQKDGLLNDELFDKYIRALIEEQEKGNDWGLTKSSKVGRLEYVKSRWWK